MYEHIIKAIFDEPWAIQPSKMEAIVSVIENKLAGFQAEGFKAAAPRPRANKRGSVAVISVHGVIAQRMNMMSEISGGTSTEQLADDINAMVNDDTVKSIVLDIDSPGGSVYGVQELASIISAATEKKHITAVANSLSASAAYWIGSQASEFVVTPSGEVGSIGVVMAHQDVSILEESMGVKTTYITAGKYKVEGNPHEPLTDDARSFLESRANDYYEPFVAAVAKGRGVSVDKVKTGFGEGRVLGAKAALAEGMVDRIDTLDGVLENLGTKRLTTRRAKARMI